MRGTLFPGVVSGGITALVVSVIFPPAGALIGGFVAGLIAAGDMKNRLIAGIASGILAAAVILAVTLVGPNIFGGVLGFVMSTGVSFYLLLLIFIFAVSGMAGGAVSRLIRK